MVRAIIKLGGEEGRVGSVSAKRLLQKHIRSRMSPQTCSLHKSFSGQRGGLQQGERRGGGSAGHTPSFTLLFPLLLEPEEETRWWEPVS